jgi:hypothetical protein
MRVLAGVTVFAALALTGSASADNPTLFGTVGPGFSIRVADGAGNRVTRIPPGTYTLVVKDQAAEHNFHLSGPGGVDMSTDVEATGTFTWTITFQLGIYHYQCDPHFTQMKGDISVEDGAPLPASAPPTTTTTTTSLPPAPPPAKPVALRAVVGPGSRIALSRGVARVRVLKAGPAVISVTDLSAKDNFHLTGPGVNRLTSRVGKTKVAWRVRLRPGIYRYRSDATPTLRGSFTVRA